MLRPLANLECLATLELTQNPVSEVQNYRQRLFEAIPTLEALDGFNAEGSDCSFEAGENLRFDGDDFQDNEFCGGFFDEATLNLRKGELQSSTAGAEKEDGDSEEEKAVEEMIHNVNEEAGEDI